MSNPRDTQFARFAELLFDELPSTPDDDSRLGIAIAAWEKTCRKIIARRAYDLVRHVCEEVEVLESDARYTAKALLEEIPDLTEWPETAQKAESVEVNGNI